MQLSQDPTSLVFFRFVCTSIIFIILAISIGMIYGPINAPTAFLLGFLGSSALRLFFDKQINYAYWWLRVFWELNVKNNLKD